MHDNIRDVLLREPSSVSHATVEAILGNDLCVVLTRRSDWYGVDGLAKVIKARAPHRLPALEAWQAQQRARIEALNKAITRRFEAKIKEYQRDFRFDLDRAAMDARFDVIAWLNGGKRNTRPAFG
jgi:uncharacterized coiled-coil protein SlyX